MSQSRFRTFSINVVLNPSPDIPCVQLFIIIVQSALALNFCLPLLFPFAESDSKGQKLLPVGHGPHIKPCFLYIGLDLWTYMEREMNFTMHYFLNHINS